ncbi:hypothetical protein D3C84_341090 [compost metagenome]
MQGDFSVLNFDPHQHERGVNPPSLGPLRNLSGVLHQQGRVTLDADLTEGELLELAWNGQAGRDIIGAGVCAVPASEPQGFRVEAAMASAGQIQVMLRPGRAWADGILTRLAGATPDPLAPVARLATYLGPPLASPVPTPEQITDGTRDAVILEVSEESLHGFQYPQRLLEPALGGPDTAERAFVNFRLRLLRLAPGEDCASILGKLRDDPASKGRLSVSLVPVLELVGDCPVVGGSGYTGFEPSQRVVATGDGAGRRLPGGRRWRLHRLRALPVPHRDRRGSARRARALQVEPVEWRAGRPWPLRLDHRPGSRADRCGTCRHRQFRPHRVLPGGPAIR